MIGRWFKRKDTHASHKHYTTSSTPIKIQLSDVNRYSRVLTNPDIIYAIIMNTNESNIFTVNIDSSNAVEKLLSKVHVGGGTYYLYASNNGVSLRILIDNNRIIGVVLEDNKNILHGIEALESLGSYRGVFNVSVSAINKNIIQWDPKYSVGIDILDRQHMEFFKIINEIFELIVSGQFHVKGDNVMKGILEYTQGHFKSEEAIMDKYNYPELDRHRMHHNSFARAVLSYYNDYTRDPENLDIAGHAFTITREWLKEHIMIVDKKYEDYFKRLDIKVDNH